MNAPELSTMCVCYIDVVTLRVNINSAVLVASRKRSITYHLPPTTSTQSAPISTTDASDTTSQQRLCNDSDSLSAAITAFTKYYGYGNYVSEAYREALMCD